MPLFMQIRNPSVNVSISKFDCSSKVINETYIHWFIMLSEIMMSTQIKSQVKM